MIRVFVVDDQELVRTGSVMILDAQPDMTVCGVADDGAQALDRLAVTAADVVLMDVRCRGGTAPRPLAASSPAARPRRCWCSAMR